MRAASLLSLWLFTVVIAASVPAQDDFPLAEGWTRMYAATDGSSTDMVTISGMAPLSVGDEWCTEFLMYDGLNDPSPAGPYVSCKTVSAAKILSVPAGVFPAIGTQDVPSPRAGYNVCGAR